MPAEAKLVQPSDVGLSLCEARENLFKRPESSVLASQHAIGSIAQFQRQLTWLERAVSNQQCDQYMQKAAMHGLAPPLNVYT